MSGPHSVDAGAGDPDGGGVCRVRGGLQQHQLQAQRAAQRQAQQQQGHPPGGESGREVRKLGYISEQVRLHIS